MTQKALFAVDNGFAFLQSLTGKEKAVKVFKNSLLGKNQEEDDDEVKMRVSFSDIEKRDIIASIAKHALIYSSIDTDAPLNENFIEFKNKLLENNVECDKIVKFLSKDKKMLGKLIDAFVEQRYNDEKCYRIIYDVEDKEVKKYINYIDSHEHSVFRKSIKGRINNFVFNKSRRDILANKQMKIDHKYYSLGKELYASIDRGNDSITQEDSAIIETHPNNKKFKLIAVADGDSKKQSGEKASNIVLYNLLTWFEKLDVKYFYRVEDLKDIFYSKLKVINELLKEQKHECSSTIACAIIGKWKTLISTIGDTRIYIIKNNKVISETKDDSYVQTLCDKGLADPKYVRFHKAIDYLKEELGDIRNEKVYSQNTKIIDNDYDKLLILSDGVTKLVTNDKIEKTLEKYDADQITERLVEIAKMEDDYLDNNASSWCNSKIEAGTANLTAAVYSKRR